MARIRNTRRRSPSTQTGLTKLKLNVINVLKGCQGHVKREAKKEATVKGAGVGGSGVKSTEVFCGCRMWPGSHEDGQETNCGGR